MAIRQIPEWEDPAPVERDPSIDFDFVVRPADWKPMTTEEMEKALAEEPWPEDPDC